MENKEKLVSALIEDPEWYDAKMAGYWIWGVSCWIGSGFISGKKCNKPQIYGPRGVHKLGKRPQISSSMGIHKLGERPDNTDIYEKPYNENIYEWFKELSNRLRYVQVVYGDWKKACGDWSDKIESSVGVFLDPPYSEKMGRNTVYYKDNLTIAYDVRRWCIEKGQKEIYRIVLAGYQDEHKELLDYGWTTYEWTRNIGYSSTSKKAVNKERFQEALFLSPHCLKPEPLFQDLTFK